jgi:hypothetical protein
LDAFVDKHLFVIDFHDAARVALLAGLRFEADLVVVHVMAFAEWDVSIAQEEVPKEFVA